MKYFNDYFNILHIKGLRFNCLAVAIAHTIHSLYESVVTKLFFSILLFLSPFPLSWTFRMAEVLCTGLAKESV